MSLSAVMETDTGKRHHSLTSFDAYDIRPTTPRRMVGGVDGGVDDRQVPSALVASPRVWVVAVMAFLIAAVAVVGGSGAALTSGVANATVLAGAGAQSHPAAPSCARSANCGGGAALSGCAFIGVTDCAPRSALGTAPIHGRVVGVEMKHLPLGASTSLFRPPQSSWI
jgi:hypothetical protein